MSRQDDIKQEIITHSRRLAILKQQQAAKGISVDPTIVIEIEDIEVKIEKLQLELSKIGDQEKAFSPGPVPRSSSGIKKSSTIFALLGLLLVCVLAVYVSLSNENNLVLLDFKWMGDTLREDDFYPLGDVSRRVQGDDIIFSTETKTGDMLWLDKVFPLTATITINFSVNNVDDCELIVGFGNGVRHRPVYYTLMTPGNISFRKYQETGDSILISEEKTEGRLVGDNTLIIMRTEENVTVQANKGEINVERDTYSDIETDQKLNKLFFRVPGSGKDSGKDCEITIKSIVVTEQ